MPGVLFRRPRALVWSRTKAGHPVEAQRVRRHGQGAAAREARRAPETKYKLSMGKPTGTGCGSHGLTGSVSSLFNDVRAYVGAA